MILVEIVPALATRHGRVPGCLDLMSEAEREHGQWGREGPSLAESAAERDVQRRTDCAEPSRTHGGKSTRAWTVMCLTSSSELAHGFHQCAHTLDIHVTSDPTPHLHRCSGPLSHSRVVCPLTYRNFTGASRWYIARLSRETPSNRSTPFSSSLILQLLSIHLLYQSTPLLPCFILCVPCHLHCRLVKLGALHQRP